MPVTISDGNGVFSGATDEDIRHRISQGLFFWLDLVGEPPAEASRLLEILGFAEPDIVWALRFGQVGRLHITATDLRAVTWIANHLGVIEEVHLVACAKGVATVWAGTAEALDDIRMKFAERADGFEKDFLHGAGILLQLLLGTLDQSLLRVDTDVEEMRIRLDDRSSSPDFVSVLPGLRKLQSFSAGFSRYSSSARSAAVGVESVSGISPRAAEEIDDYIEQVEDFEEQLFERRRWASDLTHDFSTRIAELQSAQINRLTLVSMIFLPLTAITGFFGMNFEWMNRALAGPLAFWLLGVLFPAASVGGTVFFLARKGLIRATCRR